MFRTFSTHLRNKRIFYTSKSRPIPKPDKPADDDCCNSGCETCVIDVYNEMLETYAGDIRKRLNDGKIPLTKEEEIFIKEYDNNKKNDQRSVANSAFEELEARLSSDVVDVELVELINKRCTISQEIGKAKKKDANAHFYVPGREKQIFERLSHVNHGPLDNESLVSIYREIISASLSLQHDISVAFLGPIGTYSHQAALERFGESVKFVPYSSIEDVFTAVELKQCNYGVVPLENSTIGSINATFDRFLSSPLKIRSETHISINHCVLSVAPSLNQVKTIFSHSEALKQCKKWLDLHSFLEIIPVSSTSLAAELASKDPTAASISSKICLSLYPNLNVLAENVQDLPRNSTRFAVIASESDKPSGCDKTMIYFEIDNKTPGSLCLALEMFKAHSINLTNIVSRPSKTSCDLWSYVFFAEFHGHWDDENVRNACELFKKSVNKVTFCGSFPQEMKTTDLMKVKATELRR